MSPTLILLAGGSSSRFAPLTEKNLFKFLGKSLVQWQIEKFNDRGFEDIIIICSDNNYDEIKLEASMVDEEVIVLKQIGDGQAGAVKTALSSIQSNSPVLIVNMNDIFDESLFENFENFVNEGTEGNALVGFHTDKYFPGGYLVIEGDNIVQVIEKPGEGKEPSEFVRIVFDYFSSSKKLEKALNEASSSSDDVYEVALSNMMKSGEKFKMIEHNGVWKTIKYPWHVLDMMEYFLSNIGDSHISDKAQIADTAKIIGNVIIEDGVKIFDNAIVRGPAYIGKDSIIANGALVRDSMIGDSCVVGFATEIARSYISSDCWFHTNYIGDSVLGHNVSFGSGAVTANLRLDEKIINVNIKNQKTTTNLNKLGAIIGDNVRIGINTSIYPGIRIGSGCMIASGVLVSQDIDNDKFVYSKQELTIKDNNFDITQTSRDEIKKKLK